MSVNVSSLKSLKSLVTGIDKPGSQTQLSSLIQTSTFEEDSFVLKCLFGYIDFNSEKNNKNSPQIKFLSQNFDKFSNKFAFPSAFSYSLDEHCEQVKSDPSVQTILLLSRILHLSKLQEITLTLALLDSEKFEAFALQILKLKVPHFVRAYLEVGYNNSEQESNFAETPVKTLLQILHLVGSEKLELSPDLQKGLYSSLENDFPKKCVLSPTLYTPETIGVDLLCIENKSVMTENNLAKFIQNLGPTSCTTQEEFTKVLQEFGLSHINAAQVAQVLTMMASSGASNVASDVQLQHLGSSWGPINLEQGLDAGKASSAVWNSLALVFVKAVKELLPSLNWVEVVQNFDNPYFNVTDSGAFKVIMMAIGGMGLSRESFPIDFLLGKWNNIKAQIFWIDELIKNPEGLFTFADFPSKLVNTAESKLFDEELISKRPLATWKNVDLIGCLLRIAACNVHKLCEMSKSLFNFPVKNCPDVLFFTLLHVDQTIVSPLKDLLQQSLITMFIDNPNASAILNWAYNFRAPQFQSLIMGCFGNYYMQNELDGNRIQRVLEGIHALGHKAVQVAASSTPYAFALEVAMHGANRDFLNLEKYLNDHLKSEGEPFAMELIGFIQKRIPLYLQSPQKEIHKAHLHKVKHILNAVRILHEVSSSFSVETAEVINALTKSAKPIQQIFQVGKLVGAPGGLAPSQMVVNEGPSPVYGASAANVMPGGFGGAVGGGQQGASPQKPGSGMQGQMGATGGMDPTGGIANFGQLSAQMQGLSLGGAGSYSSAGKPSVGPPQLMHQNSGGPFGGFYNSSLGDQSTHLQGAAAGGLSIAGASSRGANQTPVNGPSPSAPLSELMAAPMQKKFSQEVETETNSYFIQIYSQPIQNVQYIEHVLELLKKFKNSAIQKEKDIFQCMIRNLLDEYQFFPQYPEKELQITANLFGGIINENLIELDSLGIALKCVMESLRSMENQLMFAFGITALKRFKTKLCAYRQYCAHLTALPTWDTLPNTLKEFITYGREGQLPPSTLGTATAPGGSSVGGVSAPAGVSQLGAPKAAPPGMMTSSATVNSASLMGAAGGPGPSGVNVGPSSHPQINVGAGQGSGQPSISSTTNIDILVENASSMQMEEPTQPAQEKVAFIFNNLSQSNVSVKAEELKEVISGEKFYPWLARYLVLKRVTMETNFHTLYSSFLESLQLKLLNKTVLAETIRNIKVLLTSEKVTSNNFSDRVLLKNLGKWLGMVTIAKNKPILQRNLDVRSLLLEAYHRGTNEVMFVVPFVAKVMESAAKSLVFKPPNPWTMTIMSILAELHSDPDLKLNLKFEVEVLSRSLELDLGELLKKVRYPLKRQETISRIVPQLAAPNITTAAVVASQGQLKRTITPAEIAAAVAAQGGVVDPVILQEMQRLAAMNNQQNMQQSAVQNAPNAGGNASGNQLQMSVQSVQQQQQQQQPQQQQQQQQQRPQFAYHEINTHSVSAGVTPLVRDQYNNSVLQQNSNLRALIKPNIERTVQELVQPVIERTVRICVTTCEQMIKKDFALDPEEIRMRRSAMNITQHLTATMAMVTCKEPLLVSCTNNLRNAFNQAQANSPNNLSKEVLDNLAQQIAMDNLELCVAFIQKTAIEKALAEIERKLTTEFELRRHARNENRRYCDPKVLTYQAERMPEQLRLKVGTVERRQLIVYEEFGREIPGFANRTPQLTHNSANPNPAQMADPSDPRRMAMNPSGGQGATGMGSNDDLSYMYSKMCNELEQHLKACSQQHSASHLFLAMKQLCDNVVYAKQSRELLAAVALLQKTVESLLNGLMVSQNESQEMVLRFRDCHLLVLKGLQDPRAYGAMWTNKNVTKTLTECREPIKFSVDGIDCLIKNRLVNMQQFDMYLTTAMENGFNYTVVSFAIKLVYKYLFDENTTNALLEAKYADLFTSIEMLIRIGKNSRTPPEELSRLIELIGNSVDNSVIDRQPGGPINMMHSGISQAREFDDPPGLKEKTDILLREWVTMYHSQGSGKDSTKAFSTFVTQMHTQGILKTDDLITRFFRICTEVCVDVCYRALNDPQVSVNLSLTRARCYHTLDAFVRLIALLVRHSGDAANTLTKINLLNKVLGLLTGVLLQDHELKNTNFQQLPYHRIFIMLLLELCAPDEVLDGINFQVLTAFSYTLHVLRPNKAPGFAYAWLELISNRIFIARMLHITPQQKAWAMYAQLLIDQFRFLAPFLRNAELSRPVQLLYKGTLRVLLVLLHDFPEFLCEHHYVFADVIPPNCIQMRNLILSAFPRHMRLPDPFTPDLKVDLLRDIVHPPRILHNFAASIPASLRKDLDLYLKSRAPVTFLSEMRNHLQVSNEPGMRYNVPLMNALVLYVGVAAIQVIQSVGKTPSMSTIPHSPHMDVYQNLAVDLDTEGRYLFLNAIANHLRYPNNHTHYFSCVLLYLFAEANSEHIQEQITRVLLERVIVNRPHPWGLLITFIELINNPNFKFWTHEFVRCAPEIEKLFDSVAKSCMQRKEGTSGSATTGVPPAVGAGAGGASTVTSNRGDQISPPANNPTSNAPSTAQDN